MAVNTTLATPLTLKAGQEVSIIPEKTEIPCWNDSKLSVPHYQNMPREPDNPKAQLVATDIASVAITGGDYAVAVSRYESLNFGTRYGNLFENIQAVKNAAANGTSVTADDGGPVYPLKGTAVTSEGGNVVFQKLVWMKASDLVLGSYAQQTAIDNQAGIDNANNLKNILDNPSNPNLANNAAGNGTSSTVWIVLGVLFFLIGGIVLLVKSLKKKAEKTKEENSKQVTQPVNIIRIPKNT